MFYAMGANAYLVTLGLVFVAVLLLLRASYLLWASYKGPEARKIENRLRALAASNDRSQQAQLLKDRMLSQVPLIERWLLQMPRVHGLDRFILQAGLQWTVSRLVLSSVALGAFGAYVTIYAFRQSTVPGLVMGVALALLPIAYVNHMRNQRMRRLEQMLPEALDLMTRALRSGHAFSSALMMVGEEMAEPIAGEFKTVHDEINYGVSLQQALGNLSERVPITDLRYFVVAVLIQRDSGGNLTEVLSNLSRLIRERLKLMGKIRVLSSEGRLSAWILTVMPFVLAGLMYWGNPKFMSPLFTDPMGITIIKYMLTLMAIGIVILRAIIKIRV